MQVETLAFQEFAAFIKVETAPSVEWIEEYVVELRNKVTGDADAMDGKSCAFGDENVDESESDGISQSRLDDAGQKRVFEVVVVFFVAVKVHVLSEKIGKDFMLLVDIFGFDEAPSEFTAPFVEDAAALREVLAGPEGSGDSPGGGLNVAVALKVRADLCNSVLGDVAFDFPHGLAESSFDAPCRGSEEGMEIGQDLGAASNELTLYNVGRFGIFVVQ